MHTPAAVHAILSPARIQKLKTDTRLAGGITAGVFRFPTTSRKQGGISSRDVRGETFGVHALPPLSFHPSTFLCNKEPTSTALLVRLFKKRMRCRLVFSHSAALCVGGEAFQKKEFESSCHSTGSFRIQRPLDAVVGGQAGNHQVDSGGTSPIRAGDEKYTRRVTNGSSTGRSCCCWMRQRRLFLKLCLLREPGTCVLFGPLRKNTFYAIRPSA